MAAEVTYTATDDRRSESVGFTVVVCDPATVCGPNWNAGGYNRGDGVDLDSDLFLPDPPEYWIKAHQRMGPIVLPGAHVGEAPLSYVVRGLPDGMCFNPLSREITGIVLGPDFLTPDYLVIGPNGARSETYLRINVYD